MPPRVFILPSSSNSSDDSIEIITLPHPSTSYPTRYLLHSSLGLHEIKKITPSSNVPRSWLFNATTSCSEKIDTDNELKENPNWIANGQIVSEPSIYVSTPIDPLYLLLPHLLTKSHYIPFGDLIDSFIEDHSAGDFSKHWKRVFKSGTKYENRLKQRIIKICDSVDAGGEMSYRINKDKVVGILVKKCEKMAGMEHSPTFPKSLEEEYIKKELARPAGETSIVKEADKEKAETPKSNESKKEDEAPIQLPTPENSFSESEKTILPLSITKPIIPDTPPLISHLLRLRLSAILLSAYLPPSFQPFFLAQLCKIFSFEPLDTYLSNLATLRKEALAARATDFSMKRTIEEEEEANEKKKKRKIEEEAEKKKKKNASRAVRELSKVNTRGMAKIHSFFKKKD